MIGGLELGFLRRVVGLEPGAAGVIDLRAMAPGNEVVEHLLSNDDQAIIRFLDRYQHNDVYFGCSARKANATDGTLESCTHLNALYADFDFKLTSPSQVAEKLGSLPEPLLGAERGWGTCILAPG